MNRAITTMLSKYNCQTRNDFENALKEIIQELALLGLWRSKFFEHAAFHGGAALRILYGLDRFSEDIDFSLLAPEKNFELAPYLEAIRVELSAMDFNVEIARKNTDAISSSIESTFIKAGTKEHLLKIDVPLEISDRIGRNDRMKIKIEVDTDPPDGFETEAKTLLQPIPFAVKTYKQPDLFAGKIHALLARGWQSGRIKGRDYYDFVWFISRDIPVHLSHLEQRLRQTDTWTSSAPLTRKKLLLLLREKFEAVNIENAKQDVLPFVRDPASVEIWSNEFFNSLIAKLSCS